MECILTGQVKNKDAITVPGGGIAEMGESLGVGPYTIEFDEEENENENLAASSIEYNNSTSSMTATNVQEAIDELFTDVSEGKTLIATAVTDKGVETAATDSFQQMAENISQIETGSWLKIKAFNSLARAGGGISSYGTVSFAVEKEPAVIVLVTQPNPATSDGIPAIYGSILAKFKNQWDVISKVAVNSPDTSFIIDNISINENQVTFRVGRDNQSFLYGDYVFIYVIYNELELK